MKPAFTHHEQLKHLERRRNIVRALYYVLYLIGIASFIAMAIKSYQAYHAMDIVTQLIGGPSMIGILVFLLFVANSQAKTSVAHHDKVMALKTNESETIQ